MEGRLPKLGPVVVFDDEHFYMGSVIAERLVAAGLAIALWVDPTLIGGGGAPPPGMGGVREIQIGAFISENQNRCGSTPATV